MPPDTAPNRIAAPEPPEMDGRGAVLGIDLGGTKCHGVLAELGGRIVAQNVRPTTPGRAYETVLDCTSTLRREAATRALTVGAVALGVPAVVDPGSGLVLRGSNVGWEGFDLGRRFMDDIALPVAVENDADLAALGEARYGAARGISDFIVVSIGTGIGAAVVVDGRLVKSRHNAAGEIGAMVFDRAQLGEATRGGLGWFESVAAGPGVAAGAARLLAAQDGAGPPSELDPSTLTPAAVLVAARRGDSVAGAAVAGLLDYLAMALIALVSTLDPVIVVLEGGVGRALGPELNELRGRVFRHAPIRPKIVISALEPTATVMGALVAAGEVIRRGAPLSQFGILARSISLTGTP